MPRTHLAETTSKVAGYLIGFAKTVTPKAALPGMTRIFDRTTNSAERLTGWRKADDVLVPPLRIRLHIGPYFDPRAFKMAGEANVAAFRDLAGLGPDARFLDIGCGCGRIAIPLTKYFDGTAEYQGFDASPKPVEWCQKAITPRFPNFKFRVTDTFSQRYNPSGHAIASKLSFPYEDDKFTFAFAGSVFTHMLPEEIPNFIAETSRVLRPGGVTLATFTLLNESRLQAVLEGRTMPRLIYRFGEFQVRTLADPAHFIAQPESWIRKLYAEAGLEIIEPIKYGTWAVPTPESLELERYHLGGSPSHEASQDAIIAVKRK
ncbi:MAG TPA: class I SAM-dependent methyltransferase [Nitrososphaerales archaeon]|nr:class I SAM-dependent methyltransferase [Nitrososphaerales archaeon]